MLKYGFIGCGNMGGALIDAASKVLDGTQLLLCDVFSEKAEILAKKYGARVCNAVELAAECDFIFLGVKPQGFEDLLVQISSVLCERTANNEAFALVSMAAGIDIATVERLAACEAAVIRIMPNTPASVGEGMILYAANKKASNAKTIDAFKKVLSKAGILDELPEDKIDAASALSGCGPAFVYMFAEALADGAVECGLPRDKAMLYAAQTLNGAAKLLMESGKHPGQLKDAVCSPGGTTIAGVHALENGSFRAAAMNAVRSAYEKTLSLKK